MTNSNHWLTKVQNSVKNWEIIPPDRIEIAVAGWLTCSLGIG
jgi:hypothetical protein